MPKYVYFFAPSQAEGNKDMKNLLGGKGANLAEMENAGLPVPPGFTITTEACNEYYHAGKQFPDGMWQQALAALRQVERQTGKTFGAFTCVSYQSPKAKKQVWTTGWLPSAALEPVWPMPAPKSCKSTSRRSC